MVQQYFKQTVSNDVYTASAPGSMMLFGEHAVLRGKQAIVAAVNKRIFQSPCYVYKSRRNVKFQ